MNASERAQSDLELPQCLTIAEVSAVAAECRRLIGGPAPLCIRGEAVRRVDTAGLQLLVALAAECARRNLRLEWAGCSGELRDAARRLALEGFLPAVAPGA